MRIIISLLLAFSTTCAADFVTAVLPTKATWTGYYESAASVIVSLKPRAVIQIPEGSSLTTLPLPASLSEKEAKDHIAALKALADHLDREASRQQQAQMAAVLRDAASAARDQTKAIERMPIVTPDSLLPGAQATTEADPLLAAYNRAAARVELADRELEAARGEVRGAAKACHQRIVEYLLTADLSPIEATVSTTDKNLERFERIRSLNRWMKQLQNARERTKSAGEHRIQSIRSLMGQWDYDAIRVYAEERNIPWMIEYTKTGIARIGE